MIQWRAIRSVIMAATMAASVSAEASTDQSDTPPECWDAIVSARIVRQTPSIYSDCGPDCIIMVWPWFLKLDVKRVLSGEAPKGKLLTLTMQHTYYRKGLGIRRWWLRRNSVGGFNVVRFAEEESSLRCPPDTPPARAYIEPGGGKLLEDLLREAEEVGGGRS